MKIIASLLLMCLLVTSYSKPVSNNNFVDLIEGILVGAFGEIGHEAQTCVKDGEEIFQSIGQAVLYFKKGDMKSMAEGLAKIGGAILLIPEELEDCECFEEITRKLMELAGEFLDPYAYLAQVGEDILWHGVSILEDTRGMVKAFEAGNYTEAGIKIGDIIQKVFVPNTQNVNDIAKNVENFLLGFFSGALEDDAVSLNKCIVDSVDIIEDVEDLVSDFRGPHGIDVQDMCYDFIDLIHHTLLGVKDCPKAPKELHIFVEWAEQLKDLSLMQHKFANAFMDYSDRIKADTKSIFDSYSKKAFDVTGKSMGDFLHILFVEIKLSLKDDVLDDAVVFTTAFYKKAFEIELDLSTCEADVELEFATLKRAIDELKDLTIHEMEQGIKDLISAIPKFVHAFEACESDWPALEQGLEKLDVFVQDASKLPWAISKALTVHLIRTEEDCSEIYHAFNDSPHNYQKGGEGSGDLTELLLSELQLFKSENILIEELK